MRSFVALLLAATALGLSTPPAVAASACTAYINVSRDDVQACMRLIRRRTDDAGFNGSRTGETVFFWFDQNVVSARCIDGSLVAMAAYHRQNDRACPLLDRIKDAIQNR
jgi:hypothetical protein